MPEGVRRTLVEPMTDETFLRFSQFIQNELGIKMPPAKKTMLQARLQKRLWKLDIDSFHTYYEYVFSPEGRENELPHMIDVVTTNKTDFFREPNHFDFLVERVLPELLNNQGPEKRVTLWCAGCSTGAEPYSLAMVLRNYAEQIQDFQFFILGTDISTRVLEKAKLGIYDEETVEPVPAEFRKKYLLKSKEKDKALVRLVPEIRSNVRFRRLNLIKNDFGLRETMDIIFCRNVIIYFNRETQEQVINRLYHHLAPGGYLFTGHSETLNGLSVPLKAVAHTVYQKEHAVDLSTQLPVITLKPAELFISERPSIVRTVLGSCVAVTMFDRQLGVSAICHALLPGNDEGSELDTYTSGPYKYINSVVPLMVQRLRNYGVNIADLEVKLFGGADMMTARMGRPNYHPVGKSNIDAVIQAINAQNLQVKVSDVGGHMGRKILFYTHTGEVLLKRIKSGTEPEWAI